MFVDLHWSQNNECSGYVGLVHNSKLRNAFTSPGQAEDLVAFDQNVVVKILTVDAESKKISLSMKDVSQPFDPTVTPGKKKSDSDSSGSDETDESESEESEDDEDENVDNVENDKATSIAPLSKPSPTARASEPEYSSAIADPVVAATPLDVLALPNDAIAEKSEVTVYGGKPLRDWTVLFHDPWHGWRQPGTPQI